SEPNPAAAAFRSEPALRHQVLATLDGATQYIGRLAVPIEAKQAQYSAGAASYDIKLFVRGDEIIDEQIRRSVGIFQQVAIAQAFRHDSKRINDRAHAGCAAHTKRTSHSRGIAAFQIFSQLGDGRAGEFGRRLMTGDGRMPREKQCNARYTIVEVGPETNELENFGVAKPVQSDPGSARPFADRATRQGFGDPVGLANEHLLVRKHRDI